MAERIGTGAYLRRPCLLGSVQEVAVRCLVGLIAVLALTPLGCGESTGTGQGGGGAGGTGSGGLGGHGGHGGGLAECSNHVCPCTESGVRAAITAGGAFTFDCEGATTVWTESELVIDRDVVLDGEGKLALRGGLDHRVFSVAPGVTAVLSGLVITRGHGRGSGIFNEGRLYLERSAVIDNAWDGIVSTGTLSVERSTIAGNRGDGVMIVAGLARILNSTVSRNGERGVESLVRTFVLQSTLWGNHHFDIDVRDLVAAGNIVGTCLRKPYYEVVSRGGNIESPGDTCGFDHAADQVKVSVDALQLGPLHENGGWTATHGLGAGSVAIDAIEPSGAGCELVDLGLVDLDQRGAPRPTGEGCDTGAFEAQLECEDDGNECTGGGVRHYDDGSCSHPPVEDGRNCSLLELPGRCEADVCTGLCEGVACNRAECRSDGVCDPADGLCDYSFADDGIDCGGGAAVCQAGSCVGTFPCTDEGIVHAIAVGEGPHTFDCQGPTTVISQETIVIDNDVILDGQGNLTVDGNDDHTVFRVAEDVTAELRGFRVVRGRAEFLRDGGGINNSGTLALLDSTVSGNAAQGSGGGIYNRLAVLTLNNSIVSNNTAGGQGGGIENDRGALTLVGSTVSGNSCLGWGGGGGINSDGSFDYTGTATLIDSTVSGNDATNTDGLGGGGIRNGNSRVTLINSTVSGNRATGGGGIVYQDQWWMGELRLINSTVSGNTATQYGGGGIFAHDGRVRLTNSTVSRNGAGAIDTRAGDITLTGSIVDGDCTTRSVYLAEIGSNGYNVESAGDTCGFDQVTDQFRVHAESLALGPLQDNGGPTQTHALGEGSVAVDVIPVAACVDLDGEPLTRDQRGEPRDGLCDVGAFELQP